MHFTTAKRDYSLEIDRKSRRGVLRAKRAGMDSALSIDLRRLTISMTSLPICAASALSVVFMMAVSGPSDADRYAAAGAAFSAVIVLVAVRQFDKSFAKFFSALIGTLVFGVCAPGLTVQYFGGESEFSLLDWKLWLLLGFVFGLAGWAITESLYNTLAKLVPEAVAALFRKAFGKLVESDKKQPPDI